MQTQWTKELLIAELAKYGYQAAKQEDDYKELIFKDGFCVGWLPEIKNGEIMSAWNKSHKTIKPLLQDLDTSYAILAQEKKCQDVWNNCYEYLKPALMDCYKLLQSHSDYKLRRMEFWLYKFSINSQEIAFVGNVEDKRVLEFKISPFGHTIEQMELILKISKELQEILSPYMAKWEDYLNKHSKECAIMRNLKKYHAKTEGITEIDLV